MTTHLYRQWRRLIAVAVITLHVAGLMALAHLEGQSQKPAGQVLQISFITRPKPAPAPVIEIPATTAAPRMRAARAAATPSTALTAVSIPASKEEPAPLRLSLKNDEWAVVPPAATDHALTRPVFVDRLPGKAEAIVEGVHLAEEITPQKVVEGIGAFLFGARKVNFCDAARERLANRTSARNRLAIEEDLRYIERDCRP